MDVDLITERRRFAELRTVWNDLLDRSGVHHPFVTHEWISAWWDSFPLTGTPYILAVKDGRSIAALAPLVLDRGKMYGYPIRRLHGMGNVYTERFELLLGERPQAAAEALWGHLNRHADRWDVLELRQLPIESATLAALSGLAARDGCAVGRWPSSESPYVAVRDEWDEYLKSLKKVHRADMRKRLANLEGRGPAGMEVIQSDADFDRDFADALRLESSAWKGAQGTAIGSRPQSKAFYESLLRMAAKEGWLRLYFLTAAGKRIAVRIALLFHNRLYMLKSGYDPAYAPFSPSHLLCYKMLHEAWNERLAEMDFLGQAERWKLSWSNGIRPHVYLFLFSRRLVPRLLYGVKFQLLPRLRRTGIYERLRGSASKLGITMYEE